MRHVQLFGDLRGWRGTARTIREMHRLVDEGKKHPTVIFLAEQLARKQDRNDYVGQAAALFKWVKKNIHYVRDPRGVELLRSPFWTLHNRAGDCDDQAILFSALAEAIGFETAFKTIKANVVNPREFSHVYSLVKIPGGDWVPADTIVSYANFGWEAKERFGAQVWKGGLGMLGQFVTEAQIETELAGAVGQFTTEKDVEKALTGLGQFVIVTEPEEIEGLAGPLSFLKDVFVAPFQNAVQNVGAGLIGSATGFLNNLLGGKPDAAAAEAAARAAAEKRLPGWVAPVAVAGGAGLLAGLVFLLKRKR